MNGALVEVQGRRSLPVVADALKSFIKAMAHLRYMKSRQKPFVLTLK